MIWFFVSDQSLKIFRCREAKKSASLEIKSVCSFGVVMLSAKSFASVASWLTQLPATEQCLVADRSCSQIQALVAGAQLPVLDGAHQRHPLEWISQGLRQRRAEGDPPRVLHLIAHGRPGAFRIGEAWIDAEALKAHAA